VAENKMLRIIFELKHRYSDRTGKNSKCGASEFVLFT
jgi:hypothetical protein